MKKGWLGIILLFLLVGFLLSSNIGNNKTTPAHLTSYKDNSPQKVTKEKYDYMSTILSRNTEPLGLKENKVLKKLLDQPNIKWAIRCGEKHIFY